MKISVGESTLDAHALDRACPLVRYTRNVTSLVSFLRKGSSFLILQRNNHE